MGITLSMTGAFRETGASFFFIPKGALTHHLRSRRWYPSLRSGRALCEADRALCGERQTMPPNLRCRSSLPVRLADGCRLICIVAANRCPCLGPTCHPPATNLPQHKARPLGAAALSQRWTMPSRTVHFLLLAPKETKTPPCGEQKGRDPLWRSIIWKLRS